MASKSLDDLTQDTRERAEMLLALAKASGLDVSVVSTKRFCEDQVAGLPAIVVQGMEIRRAPGCRSWHVWGRAIDVILNSDPSPERYALLGKLGEQAGLVWGGRFKDNPDPIHFQNSGGYDIRKLCPDPDECATAIANFLLPGRGDKMQMLADPVSGSSAAIKLVAFAAGAAVGWSVVRLLERGVS